MNPALEPAEGAGTVSGARSTARGGPLADPVGCLLRWKVVDEVLVVRFETTARPGRSEVKRYGEMLALLIGPLVKKQVLLDFGGIRSPGFNPNFFFAVLVNLYKDVRPTQGVVMVCSLAPEVADVFRVLKFDLLFPIHPDEPSALAAFRHRRPRDADMSTTPGGSAP